MIAVVAIIVVNDRPLLGIVAVLLLWILDVLIDMRNSLRESAGGEGASP